MLSSGANVIILEKMLSSGANFIMESSGANVIIWCYHVMLSRMITHPFFIFPENFTHSLSRGPNELLNKSTKKMLTFDRGDNLKRVLMVISRVSKLIHCRN